MTGKNTMKLKGMASGLLCAATLALAGVASAQPTGGYLDDHDLDTAAWAPARPVPGGQTDATDIAVFFATRTLLSGPRGLEAKADDVFEPERVSGRFREALGFSPADAPALMKVIGLAQRDLGVFMEPVKVSPPQGRTRPYVQFPDAPVCSHADADRLYRMDQSGSYPSLHAALGWMWALILADAAPDRASAVLKRGYEFGESRVICGFHFPSDLTGGRLVASGVFARLQADPAFRADMEAARKQIARLRAGKPAVEVEKPSLTERVTQRVRQRLWPK
jgi:acid phosphatase (class A)